VRSREPTLAPERNNATPSNGWSAVIAASQRFNSPKPRPWGSRQRRILVSLDIREFRVQVPDMAAKVCRGLQRKTKAIAIARRWAKVILPAARTVCRLQGSTNSGLRLHIDGTDRTPLSD